MNDRDENTTGKRRARSVHRRAADSPAGKLGAVQAHREGGAARVDEHTARPGSATAAGSSSPYLAKVVDAINTGRFQSTDPQDFATMVRLRAWLVGWPVQERSMPRELEQAIDEMLARWSCAEAGERLVASEEETAAGAHQQDAGGRGRRAR